MPFNSLRLWSKHGEETYKARLQRKMCIARETPEAIFDISQCQLTAIPSGVFMLCKVLRKEALFIHENQLSAFSDGGALSNLALLKVLDVHSNNIKQLPNEMHLLVNLEILNISHNKITILPESLGELQCLQSLLASDNKLKKVPSSLRRCPNLQNLDIRRNPLRHLPLELARFEKVDGEEDEARSSPNLSDCFEATAMVQHNDCDNYSKDTSTTSNNSAIKNEYFLMQERFRHLQEQKDLEKEARLAWERSLLVDSERIIAQNAKEADNKLLDEIRTKDKELLAKLSLVHQEKEVERTQLVQQCLTDEKTICHSIQCMLQNSRRVQEQLAITTDIELMSGSWKSVDINSPQVLNAMNELVKEELEKASKLREYEKQRSEVVQAWIVNETVMSHKLAELASEHRTASSELTDALRNDERLQKAALAALMENSDTKTWQLAQQVTMIEKQLSDITKLELNKRKLAQEHNLTELSLNRITLTELLTDVLAQKKNRRDELLMRVQCLQEEKTEAVVAEEYWLGQYQRLLHSASHQLVQSMKAVDTSLQEALASNCVLHYLPILAGHLENKDSIQAISDDALREVGVDSNYDRERILLAIRTYLDTPALVPSAPLAEEVFFPSAPPLSPTDEDLCVVCMANQFDVVFLPCGHVCCCSTCANLKECPLCRARIEKIIYMRSRCYPA